MHTVVDTIAIEDIKNKLRSILLVQRTEWNTPNRLLILIDGSAVD